MSTKIYNGFKFADPDLSVIHSHIMDWRKELRSLHQRAANAFVAEIAINIFDSERMRPGSQAGKTPLMDAITMLWDRQSELRKTQRRDPLVDFEFTISLMPFEGQVYGIVYTEQREWQSLWMGKPFILDFAYWDNTDPPEELPDDEWEERGRVWGEIFDDAIMSAPSMAGFNADCTHDTLMPDTENVVAVLPTHEERVALRARFAAATARVERLKAEKGPPTTSFEGTESSLDAMEWLQTEDGGKALDAEKRRIAGILEAEVTREMLLEKL
jgi:hypothetical protein